MAKRPVAPKRRKTARSNKASVRPQLPAGPRPSRFAVPPSRSLGQSPPAWIEIPPVRGDGSFDLADVISQQAVRDIEGHGTLSFHAVGDTGRGANTEQQQVAEAMARDIDVADHAASPAFLCHLGDIIYGPDKQAHYPEKFYRPYGDYHNAIIAIPGNHDGDADQLAAYLDNFCQPSPRQPTVAQPFQRFMPNQPGAFWRLKAPFVDLIGLFSNADENIGSLTSAGRNANVQVTWVQTTLRAIAQERQANHSRKALIFAIHHPPYNRGLQTGGLGHPGNQQLLAQLDNACQYAGVWPDAVLSGHSHNYQRYTRSMPVDGRQRIVPYIIAGTGGIGIQETSTAVGAHVNGVTYVGGIKAYGYLTVRVSKTQLSIGFTQQADSHRAPLNVVTIDLSSGQLIS